MRIEVSLPENSEIVLTIEKTGRKFLFRAVGETLSVEHLEETKDANKDEKDKTT